jgi:hypothetical protein
VPSLGVIANQNESKNPSQKSASSAVKKGFKTAFRFLTSFCYWHGSLIPRAKRGNY